ncbi:hypothetical protein BDFB_002881 [Asbolus verrucosus]|uniref:C2H2-type domain-containing protein n=1 Tax=Asbolus verrucosus TaxID=1661398 RepID=A0A482VBS7_ASBVE|nr:hypothetical protein BDFB_002881 [Asbolus verrucosus]
MRLSGYNVTNVRRVKFEYGLKTHINEGHLGVATIADNVRTNANGRAHFTRKHAVSEDLKCHHCSYSRKNESELNSTWRICISVVRLSARSFTNIIRTKASEKNFGRAPDTTVSKDIKWFQCEQCAYKAKDKSSLKGHVLSKHAAPKTILRFSCDRCTFKCKNAKIRIKEARGSETFIYQTLNGSNVRTKYAYKFHQIRSRCSGRWPQIDQNTPDVEK